MSDEVSANIAGRREKKSRSLDRNWQKEISPKSLKGGLSEWR